jgi:hypothetical protein
VREENEPRVVECPRVYLTFGVNARNPYGGARFGRESALQIRKQLSILRGRKMRKRGRECSLVRVQLPACSLQQLRRGTPGTIVYPIRVDLTSQSEICRFGERFVLDMAQL